MVDFKSFLVPSRRMVMIIGNSGAVLSYVVAGRIDKTWNISDTNPESLALFAKSLERHRRVPLTVLIDMLEQSYRREAIPPVNMIDRPKVLKRRLGIAFPSHEIRAAVSLNETVGQRGDLSYLFVALPSSPELETWISFFHGLANPISSVGFLPLESSGLASALSAAQANDQSPQAEWTLLASRERTGGIRQIVVRRGRLAITRLTPPPPGQVSPADLASVMTLEMTSTLTYLTRLGYTAGDRLDMIVIGPEEMRETVEAQQNPARRMTLITPSDAAERLQLAAIDASYNGFGDLLHTAWAASKRRPALQMAGNILGQRRVQIVTAKKWVNGALAAAAVALGIFAAGMILDIVKIQKQVDEERRTEARLTALVGDLENRIETYPDRPKLMEPVLKLHDRLALQSALPLPALARISDSLGPSIRLTNLLWTAEDVRAGRNSRNQATSAAARAKAPGFKISLAVDLGAFSDGDQAISETNGLAARLSERFPESTVEIVRPPLDILPTQTLTGFNSEDAPEQVETALSADITIQDMPQ